MPSPNDSSVRRPDGSIDIEHYVAVARRARAEEARVVRNVVRAALRDLVLRPCQSRRASSTVAAAAVATPGD